MFDQASGLRQLALENKKTHGHSMRIIAVTSGKGGVGKTSFTVNLAIALRKLGFRVLIMDGDLGMANVDVAFGLTPKYTLQQLIARERKMEEIILWGPEGIGIIPGGSGIQDLSNLEKSDLENIVVNMGRLEKLTDILLIDTGAGISPTVINFLQASDDIILVTTPEPTSLTDAYSLLKVVYSERRDGPVNVVVNRVRTEKDGNATFARLNMVVSKFLNGSVNLLGWVFDDPNVFQAVMRQEPIGLSYPETRAYRCIEWVASNVMGIYKNPPRKAGGIRGFLGALFRSQE